MLRRIRMSLTKLTASGLTAMVPRLCDMTSVTRRAAVWAALPRAGPVESVNFGSASPIGWPTSMAAWMAAPRATTSSTLTPVRGGLPAISVTYERTMGMRVDPPTSSTPSRLCQSSRASPRASSVRRRVRSHEGERHGLELRPGKLEALSPRAELQGDPGRRPLREGPLGLLAAKQDLVERDRVVERIEAGLGGELLGQERGDPVVPVLAAQVMVAGGGQHCDVLGRDPGHGHVEGASAQVVDEDGLASRSCPVQAVGESGGRGLVDDSHDLEAGGVAGLDRRLALGVAEIGRDRDHGAIDGLPQGKLGIGLEPLQHKGRELGRRVGLAVELELVKRRAHVGLEETGDLRVAQSGPLLGLLAHRGGVGSEIDDRRRDVLPLAVGDDLRPPVAIAMRHDRVGSAQVDADEGGHIRTSVVLAATPSPWYDRLANPPPERLGPLGVGTDLVITDEGSDLCHRQDW